MGGGVEGAGVGSDVVCGWVGVILLVLVRRMRVMLVR